MRLEDLHFFLAVAESGHVGRASASMGLTQPALTKGLQRLENELGVQLFQRTSRGMVLTSPGEAFYKKARLVSMNLEDAMREAEALHLGNMGRIRLGIPPGYLEMLGVPACETLITQRPAARIKISVGLNDTLFKSLKFGELDLCISAISDLEEPELIQRPLITDDLIVVARRQHPLLTRSHLQLSDLLSYGWILPPENVLARRAIDARFLNARLPIPEVVIESSSTISTFLPIVKSTDLLTAIGQRSLSNMGTSLAPIPLDQARWPRKIGLCMRRDAYISPITTRLIEILEELAQSAEI